MKYKDMSKEQLIDQLKRYQEIAVKQSDLIKTCQDFIVEITMKELEKNG